MTDGIFSDEITKINAPRHCDQRDRAPVAHDRPLEGKVPCQQEGQRGHAPENAHRRRQKTPP